MKRLLSSLFLGLALTVSQLTAVSGAVPRSWKVEIAQLSSTTNKSLRVEYKVFSTVAEDNSFTSELFENGVSKGTRVINHAYGDSDVFTVAIPAAGTYTYKVVATNHNSANETKESNSVNVQVSNAPAPTVTVVNASQSNGASTVGASGPDSSTSSGATTSAASTNQPASGSSNQTQANGDGTVLGAEAPKQSATNTTRNRLIGVGVVGLLAAIGYALYRRRQAADML